MENQDLDLIGQTVGNMPYKVGITDKDGKVTNQFVVNASTNRIDIPQSALGTSEVPQIPSTTNLFSGSAVGNILLSGVKSDYSNVQDGLLLTLSDITLKAKGSYKGNMGGYVGGYIRTDISSAGLKTIKIPKQVLVVNDSFDISDQLSPYIGKLVKDQYQDDSGHWNSDRTYSIDSFSGTTIKILPNTTLSINLTVNVLTYKIDHLQIPVVQVNTYKWGDF